MMAATNKAAQILNEYFDTYVAYIADPEADFDTMDFWDIYDVFTSLKTPVEYNLNFVQLC